jgi:hypothetical protein
MFGSFVSVILDFQQFAHDFVVPVRGGAKLLGQA